MVQEFNGTKTTGEELQKRILHIQSLRKHRYAITAVLTLRVTFSVYW